MASQARHESVAPQETFAARNVVPDRGGEGEQTARWCVRPTKTAGGPHWLAFLGWWKASRLQASAPVRPPFVVWVARKRRGASLPAALQNGAMPGVPFAFYRLSVGAAGKGWSLNDKFKIKNRRKGAEADRLVRLGTLKHACSRLFTLIHAWRRGAFSYWGGPKGRKRPKRGSSIDCCRPLLPFIGLCRALSA
jgi:hypothetical protein